MEVIDCDLCKKPAHGIFTKESDIKVTRCLEHMPNIKITTAFKPVNKHLKDKHV